MREIYEIDNEAFSETDPYDTYEDFIEIIRENNLSTYSIKDEKDKLLGYYQLEPIKNNDLYIDSIGLKKEYRKTKTGYQAIKQAWTEILKYALENNVKTLSLHANAEDKSLLNMYTKMGFVVKETLPNYYKNGNAALYMVMEIPEETTSKSEAEELSPEEIYKKACLEAKKKFIEAGLPENNNKYLELCSYFDKNGNPIFSENLSQAYLTLYKNANTEDFPAYINEIFNLIKEQDNEGNSFIRGEVLGLVKLIRQKTKETYKTTKICEQAKSKDGINLEVLYFANSIVEKTGYYITDIIYSCFNPDGTFNQEIADYYKYCYVTSIPIKSIR